jgi:GT2 family glycosyltransferase
MRITIQIVNYNSRRLVRKCLKLIKESPRETSSLEVIVINNDQERLDGFFQSISPLFSIKVVEINKNIGFGRAHNRGAREATGEYILFLNPDTLVPVNFFKRITGFIKSGKNISIVGAKLVDSDGIAREEYCGSTKTPFSMIGRKLRRKNIKGGESVFCEVDWVSGGAMLIKKELFERLGGFDEKYFMYFEDVDLCLRAKNMGCKIAVDTGLEIIHQGGKSFDDKQSKKRYYYKSQDYYLRKNFGLKGALLFKILRTPLYIKNIYFNKG